MIKEAKKDIDIWSLDINSSEDLSIALMNLVALEEHCFFSYLKTDNDKYLDILEKVRESRKVLLKNMVNEDDDSEKRCMSKHFLATAMRLYEVWYKFYHSWKKQKAKNIYKEAWEQYWLFWNLNYDWVNDSDLKKSKQKKEDVINSLEEVWKEDTEKKKSIFMSIKDLLKCCIE